MALVLVEVDVLVEVVHDAVDADADEAGAARVLEHGVVLALTVADDRRQEHEAAAFGQLEDGVDDLLHRLTGRLFDELPLAALLHLVNRHKRAIRPLKREAGDQPLMKQLRERLDAAHLAQVEQHLVPEPRVQQVQHGVLAAAHVQVNAGAQPVALRVTAGEANRVLCVGEAQVVPA